MKSFSIDIPSLQVYQFKKELKQLKFLGWKFEYIQDWGILYSTFLLKGPDEHIKYLFNYFDSRW